MATLLSSITTKARRHLNEATARFWSDAELLDLQREGIKDLWKAIVDLHQEHFLTIDEANVSLEADDTTLTGVPADCFRVHLIEPRDLSSTGAGRHVMFEPRDYNHPDFAAGRAQSSVSIGNGLRITYALITAGPPVGAPTVVVAPKLSAALDLRFVYVPTIDTAALTDASNNPIPGESDNALIAWTVAWARAKEREDRTPDPEWLALYATEKTGLKVVLTPRQTQEPDYVEGMFETMY